MQEFKYKGIDLQKIKEVQEVHNDVLPPKMRIERIDFDAMMENVMTHPDLIKREIEKLAERHAECFDIVIICEMAKRFMEHEIEKFKGIFGVNRGE